MREPGGGEVYIHSEPGVVWRVEGVVGMGLRMGMKGGIEGGDGDGGGFMALVKGVMGLFYINLI